MWALNLKASITTCTKAPQGQTHGYKCNSPVQGCWTQASLLTCKLYTTWVPPTWRCHSEWASEARPPTVMHRTRGRFPGCCLICVLMVSPSLLRDTLEEANRRSVSSNRSSGRPTLLTGTSPFPDTHRTWHVDGGERREPRQRENLVKLVELCVCVMRRGRTNQQLQTLQHRRAAAAPQGGQTILWHLCNMENTIAVNWGLSAQLALCPT